MWGNLGWLVSLGPDCNINYYVLGIKVPYVKTYQVELLLDLNIPNKLKCPLTVKKKKKKIFNIYTGYYTVSL